jgi:ribosome-associated translation inhibitor RaiA
MPSRSNKRSAFAAEMPRGPKSTRGSTGPAETTLAIRTVGISVDPELRALVRQRLGRKLGKFATAIERVSVRFEDVNGPRGGIDTLCRIKVVLSGLDSVLIEETGDEPIDTFSTANARVERAVRRTLGRTSTKKVGSRSRPRSRAST